MQRGRQDLRGRKGLAEKPRDDGGPTAAVPQMVKSGSGWRARTSLDNLSEAKGKCSRAGKMACGAKLGISQP